ncbi:MAG: HNH endonuclease [Aquabacterium sp.]
MKISHDFSALWSIANRLGAARQPFTLNRASEISAIEASLIRGLEVKLDELESISGLLSYEGHQVLLYIPDQGPKIAEVLDGNIDAGKRFHVAHCTTLDSMKRSGRFERYIATTDVSGTFHVTGVDLTGRDMEDRSPLYVCINCLKHINFKQARNGGRTKLIQREFDLVEFFESYSSCFLHLPKRTNATGSAATYSPDWKEISDQARNAARWKCTDCHVDLSDHRQLLHVHHADGVKRNNAAANLQVLCKACHRMQPLHDHMYVPRHEMQLINEKRRAAGVLTRTWDCVNRYVDPACHGAIGLAQTCGWDAPEIAYHLNDCSEPLEVAWPEKRYGISLSRTQPQISGWRIHDLSASIDFFANQQAKSRSYRAQW